MKSLKCAYDVLTSVGVKFERVRNGIGRVTSLDAFHAQPLRRHGTPVKALEALAKAR